jgi:ABC-type bacteriocin/lantibiotic exporter with double-glycine peptidase domain
MLPISISALFLICTEAGLWLDVPFVKQDKGMCGAACISMVLKYWDKTQEGTEPIPEMPEIGQSLYSEQAKGIFGRDLERYFQSRDFKTFVFKAEWADLENHLSKGRPLIACLKENKRGPLHYVVVVGLTADAILVNDPARRKLLRVDRTAFQAFWAATSNWTLLALPENTARTASPIPVHNSSPPAFP